VFDTRDRIHVPLTVAVQRLERALTGNSLRSYLPTILGFFTFLETDHWQMSAHRRWDDAPDQVRRAVEDYLFQHFGCQVGLEHGGHVLVSLTAASPQTVKLFLSSLKVAGQIGRRLSVDAGAHLLVTYAISYCHPT
jgi:hypothetical protein